MVLRVLIILPQYIVPMKVKMADRLLFDDPAQRHTLLYSSPPLSKAIFPPDELYRDTCVFPKVIVFLKVS